MKALFEKIEKKVPLSVAEDQDEVEVEAGEMEDARDEAE